MGNRQTARQRTDLYQLTLTQGMISTRIKQRRPRITYYSLVGTGHVDKAAIFSADGKGVWATSSGFQVSPQEMQEVVNSFKDTANPKSIQTKGLHVAGQKYFVLNSDGDHIYGKQVRTLSGLEVRDIEG